MTTVIVGPGAIGSLVAAILRQAGNDVSLLDHDAQRADTIDRAGIRIEAGTESRTVMVPTSADCRNLTTPDLLIICVKAYDTAGAVRHAAPIVGSGTAVLSLQNGAGNVETAAEAFGEDAVVGGVTAHGVTSVGPGRIRHCGSGPTRLAPLTSSGLAQATRIAEFLSTSGLPTVAAPDLDGLVWAKLVINAAVNTTAAVARVRNGRLLDESASRETLHAAAREAGNVARARGVTLPYPDAAEAAEAVCRATAENESSMLQDVRRGRRTETDSICGTIIREAARLAVPVPTINRLHEQIKALSRSP